MKNLQKKSQIFGITLRNKDIIQVISPDAKMYYCQFIFGNGNKIVLHGIKQDEKGNLQRYLMLNMSCSYIIKRIKENWQYSIVSRDDRQLETPIELRKK